MNIIFGDDGKKAMGLDEDKIPLIDSIVSFMNKSLYVSTVDYKKGVIGIGVHHKEFDDVDYLTVNVHWDSPCAIVADVVACVKEHC